MEVVSFDMGKRGLAEPVTKIILEWEALAQEIVHKYTPSHTQNTHTRTRAP